MNTSFEPMAEATGQGRGAYAQGLLKAHGGVLGIRAAVVAGCGALHQLRLAPRAQTEATAGLTHASMLQRALPPSDSERSCVSFDSRKGTTWKAVSSELRINDRI